MVSLSPLPSPILLENKLGDIVNRREVRRRIALRVSRRRWPRPGRRLQCPHVRPFFPQGPASPFPASALPLPLPMGEAGAPGEMEPGSQACAFLSTKAGPSAEGPLLRGKVCKSLG